MAFKMKYGKSSFPFKSSAYKQSGGYGGRPGERAEETKGGAKADQRLRDVRERREERGGPRIKTFMGKPTEGQAVGGEYQMGLADYKLFGGAGKKALRDAGRSLAGDHEKYVKKKRKKRDRLKRKGKLDSHGNLKKNLDAYGNVVK